MGQEPKDYTIFVPPEKSTLEKHPTALYIRIKSLPITFS